MKKKSSVVFKNIKPIDSELWKVAKLQTREFSEKFLLKIEVKMDENAPTEDEIMVNESTGIHRTVENVLSLLMRLRQAASRCYETSEAGDIRGSEKALNEFVGILTDVVKSANESPENDEIKENAFEVLREIQSLITSSDPSSQPWGYARKIGYVPWLRVFNVQIERQKLQGAAGSCGFGFAKGYSELLGHIGELSGNM
eukprot:Gb_18676 [translate_table: standard]